MGIDLAKIQGRLDNLNNKGGKGNENFWRPQDGEQSIRIVPTADGDPFKDFWFHYEVGQNSGFLCPKKNFGDDCPVCNFAGRLFDENTEESRRMAKKFLPRQRFFSPVLVRGEEDKGVQIWGFGKMVYQSLLNIMLDEDYGDITDPLEGRDVKVVCTKPPGRMWATTTVRPRGKATALSTDADQIKTWTDNVPSLDDLYTLKTFDELEKIVNDCLNGEEDTDGTTRNATSNFTESKPSAGTTTTETTKSESSNETSTEGVSTKYRSLDDAFADLEDL